MGHLVLIGGSFVYWIPVPNSFMWIHQNLHDRDSYPRSQDMLNAYDYVEFHDISTLPINDLKMTVYWS